METVPLLRPTFSSTPIAHANGIAMAPPVSPASLMASVLVSLGVQLDGDLAETPARWTRAFREMTSGYLEDPAEILSKRFAQPAADELVLLTNISFVSLCEHHLLPFSGVAHVGYLPSGFVVGISKLARLVDCHAKRLQIQERMTLDVTKAIETHLATTAAGCIIEATHSCISCRGIRKAGASMTTSCLLGRLRTDPMMRSEFLSLVGK
jgi:GTP cyclohydrolase I